MLGQSITSILNQKAGLQNLLDELNRLKNLNASAESSIHSEK